MHAHNYTICTDLVEQSRKKSLLSLAYDCVDLLHMCRYLEYNIFNEHSDAVCFITPDVTQFIKLYEGR